MLAPSVSQERRQVMPGFDGTGPRGMGPMTGGGRGFCALPLPPARPTYGGGGAYPPYGVPWGMPYYGAGSTAPGAGPFVPQMTHEQELDFLKNQAQAMRGHLEQIETRIKKLGSNKE